MAVTPKFLGLSGAYIDFLNISTNQLNYQLSGKIDRSTIDLQVSIRGGEFTSDNDYVSFEGETFYIPNPNVFPDGLDLSLGVNIIKVRAIDLSGTISANATAQIRAVQNSEIPAFVQPPTMVTLERMDGYVKLIVRGIEDGRVVGYNFYCSISPGGGPQGYNRINLSPVKDFYSISEEISLGTFSSDVDLVLNQAGTQLAADPLFYQYQGSQTNSDEVTLQADFNELVEIPEDVRKIRTTINLNRVDEVDNYYFYHDRNASTKSKYPGIPNGDFASTLENDPLYYVITALFFDDLTQTVIESPNSEEVAGYPTRVSAAIGSFPVITNQQIEQDISLKVYRKRPEVDIQAGSFTRDTFIDPAVSALVRTQFLIDFAHRAQSFATLIEIDDPRREGVSVPVAQSQYKLGLKQALYLVEDSSVQEVLDQAFEKRASDYGVFRKSGIRSRGEVTFYTNRLPTSDITVPIGTIVSGGANIRFRTTSNAQITVSNIASFYNPFTGRYSVKAYIESESPGSATVLGNNQIRTIVTGPQGLSVINENPTFGGKDLQSNLSLATEAQNKLSSIDTSTKQGIRRVAVGVSGVIQTIIAGPGDSLMFRDIDPSTGEHLGGKVDVWVRGTRSGTVTDVFAFSFQIANGINFEPFGDPVNLEFISTDTSLSEDNPIVEMLNYSDLGFSFRNDTRGIEFDLTAVSIIDYNRIKLSTTVVQPEFAITDVIRGDYRYRTSNSYIFPRQPVNSISSLTGTLTGKVTPSVYRIRRIDSPLRTGRSTKAGDYLELVDPLSAGVVIPSSTPIQVTDEVVVIVGEYPEYFKNLGINPVSIVVYSSDRSVTYRGPYVQNSDYIIVTNGSSVGIQRIITGQIASGQTLSIDYKHDENFTVTYNIDFLISTVQNSLDLVRHTSSDVIVKKTVNNFVDLLGSVVLKNGISPATVDSQIRSSLSNFIENLGLNTSLRLSDVIRLIDQTQGVSYVIIPSMSMVRAPNSTVIGEFIGNSGILMTSLSSSRVSVYLLQDSLDNNTTDGGGPSNLYPYIILNNSETDLLQTRPDTLFEKPNRSYIIGTQGLVINGYSDDATLISQGFLTPSEIDTERKRLTSNHVLVSLLNTDSLSNYVIQAGYVTSKKSSGSDDIIATTVENLSLGLSVFTYDQDRG